MTKGTAKDHARIIWCMRLRSALQIAFACAIVGGASLYGPSFVRTQITFPALSYMVVLLILSNATTLGHALSGCWHAFQAVVQVIPLAMLGRWLFAPGEGGRMQVGVAAMAAGVATFLVALPESTHVTAKRIALAQIALVCTEVAVSIDGTRRGIMNPVHVGASAVLGASACLLALLLPFPELAHHKVQNLCKIYAENASERMDIYLRAFDAQTFNTKIELVLQAKPIAEMGNKILHGIKILQEGMPWERPWSNFFDVEKILQSIELPLRAMEYSLLSSSHVQTSDQRAPSTDSLALSSKLHKKIRKVRRFSRSDSQTRDDKLAKNIHKPLESTLPTQYHELASFFFSCVDMLLVKSTNDEPLHQKTESGITQKLKSWILQLANGRRLEPAIKYSFALGMSVLLSVILERENAIWASLTVATSFAEGRPAIFTVGNARAQGTAIGSVYGVLCCILFRRTEIRLVALLPWIVFTTFLKHSKMYGPPGGVSAAVAALFILGRKNYGETNEFAIDRLTSVFIGLFCLLLSELVLQPVRATTLAKKHLSLTLVSLRELLQETRLYFDREQSQMVSKFTMLVEGQRVLKSLVADAESEPGFWYLPHHTPCYKKAVGCLYNVVSLLHVVMYNLKMLSGLQDSGGVERMEFEEQLNYELEVLQRTVDSSLERISLIKSTAAADDKPADLETGESGEPENLSGLINEEVVRIAEERESEDDDEHLRERLVRCLGVLGFCIHSLRKEIDQIEICMKEIVRWESSSTQ